MIEINLLPEELRKKESFKFNIPKEGLKNSFTVLLPAGIVFIHIFIQGIIITKGLMLKQAEGAFRAVGPQKKQLDEMEFQIQKIKALDEFFLRSASQRLITAQKLNIISDVLPPELWLTELSVSKDIWEIKGGSVSAAAQDMANIRKFLNALKTNKQISGSLSSLELVSVQRNKLGPTEVVDFTISSKSQTKAGQEKKF